MNLQVRSSKPCRIESRRCHRPSVLPNRLSGHGAQHVGIPFFARWRRLSARNPVCPIVESLGEGGRAAELSVLDGGCSKTGRESCTAILVTVYLLMSRDMTLRPPKLVASLGLEGSMARMGPTWRGLALGKEIDFSGCGLENIRRTADRVGGFLQTVHHQVKPSPHLDLDTLEDVQPANLSTHTAHHCRSRPWACASDAQSPANDVAECGETPRSAHVQPRGSSACNALHLP